MSEIPLCSSVVSNELKSFSFETVTVNNKGEIIDGVSWDHAVEFCARLSQKLGSDYRLPSEAEWEYACRSGTTTPFYFGETITTELANYKGTDSVYQDKTYPGNYGSGSKGEYRGKTTEVGNFPPNLFGLYDMHGNIWEWCQDAYHNRYKGVPTDGSAWMDKNENQYRVLRGGWWYNTPDDCRSALRYWFTPVPRYNHFGFRVVLGGDARNLH